MIQLRPACFSDLELLQIWDKAPHVIAAKGTEDWGWQTELNRQPDWIGEATCIGRGFGKEMMELALQRCFADERVNAILIDPMASNTRARRFYEKLGFCLVEYHCFTKVECAVYRLDRNV